MRAHSPNVYRHTVTLQRTPDVIGPQGGANPSPSGSPVTLKANVQFGEGRVMDVETSRGTIARTVSEVEVYLPSDPGVKRGDYFLYGATKLNIKGPAQDTGYGFQFWVDCEAVS